MKHVLVLNQFALPRTEGGGTRHIDLFSRVEGWQPLIVTGSRNHYSQAVFATDDDRFKLVWVPPYTGAGLLRMLGWVVFAVRATVVGMTRPRLDVVYASTPQLLVPVAGAAVASLRRVPLVVEVRDLWPESIVEAGAIRRDGRLHHALTRLERWIYRRADRIVVVTPGWEQHLADLGVDPRKVQVVANGADLTDFVVDEDRNVLRSEYGISGFTAVFAGAHGPANGLDSLLDAVGNLADITLLLVGAGSQKARLQQRAVEERLGNVEFRDPIPKWELARLLKACDVGVHTVEPLPVLAQGMSPNKLFDYMASGLPIVSNAGAGLREVVMDGECGSIGGPDSLDDGLRRVAEADHATRAAWARRGQELVELRFSRVAAARRLRAILDEVRSDIRTRVRK